MQTTQQRLVVHYSDRGNVAHVENFFRRPWVEIPKEKQFFNTYQWFLLQRCLKGLKVYDEEELAYFSQAKKQRITKVHLHSLDVLNEYCQRVIIALTNNLLVKHFKCISWGVQKFIQCNETDQEFKVSLSFKDLGITPKMVATELVDKRCLPWNYFELTLHDDPRMIKLKQPSEPIDKL